jgi:tetratricopeptide (TPR) repeat protein
MPEPTHPTFPALDFLQYRLKEGADRYRFWPGVAEEKIDLLETAYRIVFPPSHREFLQTCNGGMITPEPASYYQDMTDEEPDGPIDSSFCLFSLDQIHEHYEELMLDDWLMGEEVEGFYPYPIIPIGQSPDKRLLLVFSQPGFEKESPVYISLEDEMGCAEVSESFAEFLKLYLKNMGLPPLPDQDEDGKGSYRLSVHEMLVIAEDEEHPEQAIERYHALIQLFPDDAWYYSQRGLAYQALEQRQKALKDFNQAIRMDGNKAFYRYCRGDLLLSYGSPRQALIDLDLAVRLEPGNKLYHYLRASAFFALERYPEALEDCHAALRIAPLYVIALELRLRIYRLLGEEELAQIDAQMLDDLER